MSANSIMVLGVSPINAFTWLILTLVICCTFGQGT